MIYDWYGWPNAVTIHCPECGSKASLKNPKQHIEMVGPSTRPLKRKYTDFADGHISCLNCGLIKEIRIEWPVDAYYQGDVKGKLLWAWNKEHAIAIRNFIDSMERVYLGVRYSSALYHLPEHFEPAKNKGACLKALERMIHKL